MLSALLALLSSFSFAAWDLNDLSILMPLPANGEEQLMLHARSPGQGGVLMPPPVYEALPGIVVGGDKQAIYERFLKVVAVRIDPCFAEGTAPRNCLRQIRLVWQPLKAAPNGWSTHDAAIHTFHVLDENQWSSLLTSLRELKTKGFLATGLPLQVHPVLRAQGYRGPYWKELSRLLLSFCGPQNLWRATAMTVNPMGNVWVFTGFNVNQGQLQRIQIARLQRPAQSVFVNIRDVSEFIMDISPAPENEIPLLTLVRDSKTAQKVKPEAEIAEAVRRAVIFENPRLHNPGTLDCASCHIARNVGLWAQERYPRWSWNQLFGKELYRGPGQLSNTTRQNRRVDALRAFGYFEKDPIISQRVINESSASLSVVK
ncbi:MAG: hypothetical protein KF802_08970 [Bdellovibrionaceae bacterium]|nr:hypothetical protein [Pseudobdellovibrionaceae bacterium]